VSELATALALLIRPLALTVRVLLLLAGLLAAALLLAGLLAGLLARVLVLLARVLVLVGHRDLPLLNATFWLNVTEVDNPQPRIWFREKSRSIGIIAWRRLVATVADGTPKLALYKPFEPRLALLPHRVPAVRKRDVASGCRGLRRDLLKWAFSYGKPDSTLPENAPDNGSAWIISPSN
jgi:hypothetical protein